MSRRPAGSEPSRLAIDCHSGPKKGLGGCLLGIHGEATDEWSVAVDHDRRPIVTCWGPVATDAGLSADQRQVSLDPDHRGYDELLDFLGLARMYAACRVARESSRREVMVFTSREQADGRLDRPRARSSRERPRG